MSKGTKSLLFGAHQFIIHPLMVFLAWWKLYGFPADPRLWLAFLVHDWGYWGCCNMDDIKGKQHTMYGARIMKRFGPRWFFLCLFHSRHLCRRLGQLPSRLCVADKYVTCIEPSWFYLPRARLTGELEEYMNSKKEDASDWYKDLQLSLGAWVNDNKDKTSTW